MDSVHSPWTARPSVHDETMDRDGGELSGRGARWCSRAWDLTVVAWGARGADEDPYPGWHELVEGLRRPGVSEGRRWHSKLNEEVLGVRG
jgi:hypothetical protein